MVSDVRVAQYIGFKFQVIQPVLNDIANGRTPGRADGVEPEPLCVYNPNYHVVRSRFLPGASGNRRGCPMSHLPASR
jgi:hypothetical protein